MQKTSRGEVGSGGGGMVVLVTDLPDWKSSNKAFSAPPSMVRTCRPERAGACLGWHGQSKLPFIPLSLLWGVSGTCGLGLSIPSRPRSVAGNTGCLCPTWPTPVQCLLRLLCSLWCWAGGLWKGDPLSSVTQAGGFPGKRVFENSAVGVGRQGQACAGSLSSGSGPRFPLLPVTAHGPQKPRAEGPFLHPIPTASWLQRPPSFCLFMPPSAGPKSQIENSCGLRPVTQDHTEPRKNCFLTVCM